MHELSIAQGLLAKALAEASKRRATRLAALYSSHSDGLEPAPLEWSFRMVSQGTIAEGAQLYARMGECGGGVATLEGMDVDVCNSPLASQHSEPGDYCTGGPASCQG